VRFLREIRARYLRERGRGGQTCQDCWRHFGDGRFGGAIDFIVSTALWNFVMSGGERQQTIYTVRPDAMGRMRPMSEGKGGVVCLACFDRRARALDVEYRDHVVAFGSGCWMGGTFDEGIPL
jgi:hypothetical protein